MVLGRPRFLVNLKIRNLVLLRLNQRRRGVRQRPMGQSLNVLPVPFLPDGNPLGS